VYSGVPSNPKVGDLEKGIALFRSRPHDVIVAVGGGSVIDMAKMVKVAAPSSHPAEMLVVGKERATDPGVPMIAVPTTAGTGAEVTHFAVVYIESNKYSLATDAMLPEHVILDHDLTRTLPAYQIAATGVDALAQAVEAYWSVCATDESRNYSHEAIELIVPALRGAVGEGTDGQREAMLRGANLAGKAINIARTTAPHALSYAFTTRYGVAHGHAVGLTLGAVFEHNSRVTGADAIDPRGLAYSRDRMSELVELIGVGSAADIRAWHDTLMADIALPTRLRDLSVSRDDLPDLARAVNSERLRNNPRELTTESIGRLLESIY
jgi:alcohol dehydrogenase class IV